MLLHLPVGLSSHQTAQRRLSGAHSDRSQSHRQWLAVTAPAGRAHAVERVEATCRREPRCCQTKQVPKKGVEGRRREARRRPKKVASVWLFGPVSALRNFSDSLLERRITIRPPLSTTPYVPSEEDVAELRARCAYPRPRGADPERTPICIWVSSTGFRQPGLLCAFRRRLVTVHVSPVSPSLTKEGNAACARQVCRKVTTRETRDQRRISTWYQNLRVLSAQSSGRSPEG